MLFKCFSGHFFILKNQVQCFVRACKAIFGHLSCHAKNRLGSKPTKIKTCMYTVEA